MPITNVMKVNTWDSFVPSLPDIPHVLHTSWSTRRSMRSGVVQAHSCRSVCATTCPHLLTRHSYPETWTGNCCQRSLVRLATLPKAQTNSLFMRANAAGRKWLEFSVIFLSYKATQAYRFKGARPASPVTEVFSQNVPPPPVAEAFS
jgi:hypothetical protein